MKRARHVRHRRGIRLLRASLIALGALVALGGGVAYAGYRYESANAGKILPGIRVAGVDLGGMTRAEALDAVSEKVDERLDREILVRAGKRSWHIRPREMGMRANVKSRVGAALRASREMPWHARLVHRVFDRPVDRNFGLRFSHGKKRVNTFVDAVARATYVSPSDASVELVDGKLSLNEPEKGVELAEGHARKSLTAALAAEKDRVRLRLRTLEPEVTEDQLGHTIVVNLSELKLYLYDGVELVKTYPVAAGTSEYPTPPGTWTIWDKRENPTWVNPAPDGWGAGMPAVIGPGPGNPLGTHALYLDAPGIRIHGTYAEGSIGTYASHGCIRMTLEDSKELFSIVDVGTQVHII